jgi:hypothetical protein
MLYSLQLESVKLKFVLLTLCASKVFFTNNLAKPHPAMPSPAEPCRALPNLAD